MPGSWEEWIFRNKCYFRVFGGLSLEERRSGPGEEEGERSDFKGRDTKRQLKTLPGK